MRRSILLTCLAACSLLLAKAQVKPQRIRVSSGVAQGLLVSKVEPEYPPLAHPASLQGTVILKIVISKSGDVESVELVSGHPLLAPSAIDAVRKWKYRPYLLNGSPVIVETQVSVIFSLTDNPPEQASSLHAAESAAQHDSPVPSDALVGPVRNVVPVPSSVEGALIVKKVAPLYPEEARQNYIEGTVLMKVTIGKQGDITSMYVISGHPLLVPAAMEAVRQWKYKPYLLNGSAVDVETQVRVNFALTRE